MGSLLVLWDVDNTLIANGGVSKDAYGGAFELLTMTSPVHRARTGGSTDFLIMRDLVERHGMPFTDEMAARIPEALEASLSARRSDLAVRGRELPGARAALAALAEIKGVYQSVLTGNMQPNGFTKLDTFGLAGPPLDWEVGAYGSDDSIRSNLVGIAQKRASRKYGEPFARDNTLLIGDTPNDVRAGLDGGARVLAIASGSDTVEQLADAGADIVLPDLADTDAVLAALKRALA
ncbi:haloacid dehalogenase-like hydrolase [Actinomadura fulvescens]|uniref:Haloacid dehalogenase-like hydrolase n=1 Tax=Actinomadura fulvescens TaxID=46160 RepID=A0ABP6DDF2_9ACTN